MEKLRKKYNLPEKFIDEIVQLVKHNRNQGVHIKNSDGKKIHVRDIAEQHILEDFRMKFIPTLSDFLSNMKLLPWMNNAMSSIQSSEFTNDNKVKQINIKIDTKGSNKTSRNMREAYLKTRLNKTSSI